MQEGDQEKEEVLPLFYRVPLPRLLAWNRWWHIVSRILLIAYQKRTGNYLKLPEVRVAVKTHLARVRLHWGRGRGRLLQQLAITHQSSRWKAPLHSTLWQNQEIYTQHLEGDVERKDLRP